MVRSDRRGPGSILPENNGREFCRGETGFFSAGRSEYLLQGAAPQGALHGGGKRGPQNHSLFLFPGDDRKSQRSARGPLRVDDHREHGGSCPAGNPGPFCGIARRERPDLSDSGGRYRAEYPVCEHDHFLRTADQAFPDASGRRQGMADGPGSQSPGLSAFMRGDSRRSCHAASGGETAPV